MTLHFVKLELRNKKYKQKVSTEGCTDVDDFKLAIKNKFPHLLGGYDPAQLTLFEPDGITEIDPETQVSDLKEIVWHPMVVTVDTVESSQNPSISVSRHQDYKHSKAVHSSRSYLTSIAVELDHIYPIPGRTSKGIRYVTIGDIFHEASENNPEPKPEFRNTYKRRLNDFFLGDEWKVLKKLNDIVNPDLHLVLPFLLDGRKEVILPIDVSHLGPNYQRIAKKSNVVSDESLLNVKNEGSVSGSSPT